ncbi:MAG: helicase C-terminal domain-containing protein [Candidatus Bathyarchaeia archaeon]
MAAQVQCPNCGRVYSAEEYGKDRFCRDCKALLDRIGYDYRRLFPYEPYPAQVEFMEDVHRVVGSRRVLMAEACNGFGKTVSALSSLLPLGKGVIYATRTHEQVRQVLAEVKMINRKSGGRFTAVNLASRGHLCLNHECRELPHREAAEVCRIFREGGECPYSSEIEDLPRGLPKVMDPESLTRAGRRLGLCPYFLARRVARYSRVIVLPYVYVFDPHVRESSGIQLSEKILVLDEGHNIDRVGQEILSDTLNASLIEMAASELKSVGKPQSHMKRLSDFVKKQVSDGCLMVESGRLGRDLELALGVELRDFIEIYSDTVNMIRSLKTQRGEAPVCHLNGILSFLSLVSSSRKDQYIALCQRNAYGVETIEYRCLDPSLALRPVIEQAAGALVMSGTLSPIDLFTSIIGLKDVEVKRYPAVQGSREIKTTIDATVTTRFRDRGEEMIRRIGRIIAVDLLEVPNGALIFFPQRQFMEKCLDSWWLDGVLEVKEGGLFLSGKPIFTEGRDARENRDVVENYKKASSTPRGAILCCVFRGRNAEGSNFPDEQARGIFLIGVPYANYSDPLVQAQMRYFNSRLKGLGRRWYTMDAFRAANQAMGRGIRGRDDWCRYWLLDERYVENIDLLSKWAVGSSPVVRGGRNCGVPSCNRV